VGFGRTPLSHVVGLSECTAVLSAGSIAQSTHHVHTIPERLQRL